MGYPAINQVSNTVHLAEEFIINLVEETLEIGPGDSITMDLVEDTIEVLTTEEIITVSPEEEVLQFNLSEVIEIIKPVETGLQYAEDAITSIRVVASHSTKIYTAIRWLVYARSTIDPTNKKYFQVSAFHDGDSVDDATQVKFFCIGNMTFGLDIIDIDFDVQLSGAGANQVMSLTVQSTEEVDVRVSADAIVEM